MRLCAAFSRLWQPSKSQTIEFLVTSKKLHPGPLAQRLEQRTHNPLVVGSNPTGPTIACIAIPHCATAVRLDQARGYLGSKSNNPAAPSVVADNRVNSDTYEPVASNVLPIQTGPMAPAMA
jgi:hypothetical protein